MTTRTRTQTMTFRRPFVLAGFDEALPAGAYDVETDEELLEGVSFLAYRRVLTVLHLHPQPGQPGVTQSLTVDGAGLEAALRRDATDTPSGRVRLGDGVVAAAGATVRGA